MASMKLWFDEEGDFLEVRLAEGMGSFREIAPDVYERVDDQGRVLGFAIFNFLGRHPRMVELPLDAASLVAS